MKARTAALSAIAGLLIMLGGAPAFAQQGGDICTAPDKRVSCSMQCCGRRACPPSCEVDCVKACVDACASPGAMNDFMSRIKQLQVRCGNRSVR